MQFIFAASQMLELTRSHQQQGCAGLNTGLGLSTSATPISTQVGDNSGMGSGGGGTGGENYTSADEFLTVC